MAEELLIIIAYGMVVCVCLCVCVCDGYVSTWQPLQKIHDYFGAKIALYAIIPLPIYIYPGCP
eukprot:COSAG05_NODE_2312_length_3243_cov_2.859097_6_plen_63_part_00